MIKANIKVGNATIQVEGENPCSLVEQAGFWGECPTKCGHCNSENIGFFSRTPSGNLYVGMKCRDCGYEFNFGQNKEPKGGLFIRHDQEWQAPYGGGGSGGGSSSPEYADGGPDDDDIPF
jgi:hypothetical protein